MLHALPIRLGLENNDWFAWRPPHPGSGEVDGREENPFRAIADDRVEHPEGVAVYLHGRVSHIRSKQRRALSEPLQAIDRAVKDSGHCERVICSVPHEHAEVGITERLGEYFEMKAIG